MRRNDRAIAAFVGFEAAALSLLVLLATSAVDEFRYIDPLGYWPAFVVGLAFAKSALLTVAALTAGWGLSRLRALFSARRIARIFQHA